MPCSIGAFISIRSYKDFNSFNTNALSSSEKFEEFKGDYSNYKRKMK